MCVYYSFLVWYTTNHSTCILYTDSMNSLALPTQISYVWNWIICVKWMELGWYVVLLLEWMNFFFSLSENHPVIFIVIFTSSYWFSSHSNFAWFLQLENFLLFKLYKCEWVTIFELPMSMWIIRGIIESYKLELIVKVFL